jgi:ABC-2 type transport system permease protein/oleandomycin transport system permease protein
VPRALIIAGRNLTVLRRLPQLLGLRDRAAGAVRADVPLRLRRRDSDPGESYVNYLMPGIFAQTVAFGAITTAVGLSEDLGKGLVDRFRTLPMARSAVLAGRTLADLVRNVGVVLLMVAMGYLVGFRVQTSALALVAALLVLLLFGFALSWVFALIGLSVANAESAQAAAFPLLFPLVFASSAFVPTATMPGPLRAFAEHQPVTAAVDAVRALVLGGPTTGPVLTSLAWSIGILGVAAPLAVHRYRRATG